MTTERDYYNTVCGWLREEEGCFHAGFDKGPRFGRPDILGVRHVGGSLATDYEIVAVEVKTDESFFSSLSQAAGYSVFAHRSYLAEVERGKGRFSREQIEMALHLGVGLLKIRSMSTGGVEPLLDAPASRPPRRFALQMLEAHGLSECVVCKGVFRGTWKNGVKRSDRKDVRLMLSRAIENTDQDKPTGYLYWSDTAADLKAAAGDGESNDARRYICPDCLTNIIKPLLNYSQGEMGKKERNIILEDSSQSVDK